MFLPDYTKRLFFNVPTLFIKCADTFHQMCRHIDFSAHKYTLNYFSGADMVYSSTNTLIFTMFNNLFAVDFGCKIFKIAALGCSPAVVKIDGIGSEDMVDAP